jgi:hypothetical protein
MADFGHRRPHAKAKIATQRDFRCRHAAGADGRTKLSFQTIFTMVSVAIIFAECLLICGAITERAYPSMNEGMQVFIAEGG